MKIKTTKKSIEEFLNSDTIAIAGVSRNPKKFGYAVFNELKKKGLNVIPINPYTESIEGEKCYSDLNTLPSPADAVIIVTSKMETDRIVQQALGQGIKKIWIQQGSGTKQTEDILSDYEGNFIIGKCILMFAEPVNSIHSFHRFFIKLFGALPK